MRYKVIVYYDNMPDSEHIFSNKNDAINELHRDMFSFATSAFRIVLNALLRSAFLRLALPEAIPPFTRC